MVAQYPHMITGQTIGIQTQPVLNANGDYVIPAPSGNTTFASLCRARPNGEGKRVVSEDGQTLEFSYLIYLPTSANDFIPGTSITVTGIYNGIVKRFFRGQLNCMLWV